MFALRVYTANPANLRECGPGNKRSSPSFQYFNSHARLQAIDTALRIILKCNDNE